VVAEVRERLAINKQRMHSFHIVRLNTKSGIVLRSQIGLQLWKIWTFKRIIIVLVNLLEKILKFQPKRVSVIAHSQVALLRVFVLLSHFN
jgi:hypothetical protein